MSIKEIGLNFIRKFGYEVYRKGGELHGELYTKIEPRATYSPWNKDAEFLETFHAIQSHTLVDLYRCYELWTLVEQTRKTEGGLIEVGVWRGGTGALIRRKAQLCGIEAPIYLCDTFTGVAKATENDSTYKGGEHSDTSQRIVEQLFDSLRLPAPLMLKGIFPDQTAHLIPESRFRFCHIDVDVYQSAKAVTEWVWDKMSIGGIVAYDDYGFWGCDGIVKYLDEQNNLLDRIILYNLNGHAIVVKIA